MQPWYRIGSIVWAGEHSHCKANQFKLISDQPRCTSCFTVLLQQQMMVTTQGPTNSHHPIYKDTIP